MPRRLLYVVPAFATLVAGYALLGPGRGRVVMGARVLVADDADDRVRSLRLQIVERLGGIEEPRAADAITVFVDGLAAWQGATSSNGIIEVQVHDPKVGPTLVEVVRFGEALASGRVESPRAALDRRSPDAQGNVTGSASIAVAVPRGQLVPPFPEAVTITVKRPDGSTGEGVVKLSAFGGGIEPEASALRDGVAKATLTALVPPVSLEASAELSRGDRGSWSGELPVSLGSIWLDPRSTRAHLELATRSPHREAFVSLYDAHGRMGGLVVALAPADDGMYRGGADLDASSTGPLTAVVATDPQERGLTTVAWPIDPPSRTVVPGSLHAVLDGIAGAEAREAARRSRVRRITAGFLGAATLLEIFLLLVESRRTRRELTRHFAETTGEREEFEDGREESAPGSDERGATKLVVSARSTLLVVVTVGLLLALSAVTLAALNFAGS